MTVRRSPGRGQSRPLACASATSPSLAPSCPRAPAPRAGMQIPHHSAAASALVCGPGAGSTAQCCARRAGNAADAPSAGVRAAAAQVLCVSVAIPLLREKESRLAPPLHPRQSLKIAIWVWTNLRAWRAARRRFVLPLVTSGVASGGSRWTATPVPPAAAVVADATGRVLPGERTPTSLPAPRQHWWCSGWSGLSRPR